MGTTANLTVFALLRGQPMLRRPYLGTGEATKRQAVATWNALPSKRRHFVAIDGQSRQRTEQNHGVKQSSPPRQLGGRPGMRSSRCPLVACLDVMGSSVPPAPMDLFGSSALCLASEFARFPKLWGYANFFEGHPRSRPQRRSILAKSRNAFLAGPCFSAAAPEHLQLADQERGDKILAQEYVPR